MKKQSAAGLFFSMFLRAAVVILGIAIVSFGIVILMKVIKHDNRQIAPATTVGENVLTEAGGRDEQIYETTGETTQAPVVDENAEPAYHKNILVLNSTNIQGLAGRWCERLNTAGYVNTFASDYSTAQETTRVISKTEGVGTELVEFFNGASYEVGDVTEGTSTSTTNYDIIIIIGTSDNDQ
ncbi:MAG: LytR C-terminal domain-containing protein [Eubacteriales bacterium]|nr:LytR C-terminal domain-containing protein [Eubacteriales bacterium]